MGTIKNGIKWSGCCVDGNVISGLAKNGEVFYEKNEAMNYMQITSFEQTENLSYRANDRPEINGTIPAGKTIIVSYDYYFKYRLSDKVEDNETAIMQIDENTYSWNNMVKGTSTSDKINYVEYSGHFEKEYILKSDLSGPVLQIIRNKTDGIIKLTNISLIVKENK